MCRASWGLVDGQGRPDPGRTWSPRFSVGQRAPGRIRSQAHRKNPAFAAGLSSGVLCVWPLAGGCRQPDRAKSCPPIKPSLTGRAACCIAKRAPGAVGESSHRTESPRPAALGELRALALLLERLTDPTAVSEAQVRVPRLSRPVVRGVNRAARRGVGCQEGRPMSVYRIASKRE